MAQKEINSNRFTPDILDFIIYLNKYEVKYVIVSGQAVIYYGHSRLTGDVDFYYERTEANCNRLFQALYEFWGGEIPGLKAEEDLNKKNMVFQFGIPPNRIDLINEISGLEFNQVWEDREIVKLKLPTGSMDLFFIGLDLLIKNKEKVARPRDLEDLKFLKSLK